jgi:hypothetical protein
MKLIFLVFLILTGSFVAAQKTDDLFDRLGDWDEGEALAIKTFRSTRIVNMQSVENPYQGELIFTIGHRFGNIRSGFYEMFGLDIATIRLGLDYGINSWLAAGIGRSSFQKTFDGYLKARIITQDGGLESPVSLSYYLSASHASLRNIYPADYDNFPDRTSYIHQLMVSRMFSELFSVQISPIWLISSYLTETGSSVSHLSLGTAARIRLTPMTHLNLEYIPSVVDGGIERTNPVSAGFDIETGGHVFQLFFSNTQGIADKAWLANTSGRWEKGDIFFGFTITRVFYL